MKAKIINMYYIYGGDDGRLVKFSAPSGQPWTVYAAQDVRKFPTRAEAIRCADELALRLREVS